MRTLAFKESGSPITRLTMGLDAFDLFFADAKVQALLKTELGAIPRTSERPMLPATWRPTEEAAERAADWSIFSAIVGLAASRAAARSAAACSRSRTRSAAAR